MKKRTQNLKLWMQFAGKIFNTSRFPLPDWRFSINHRLILLVLWLSFSSATIAGEFKTSYFYYIKAQALIAEGKFSEALAELQKVIIADPSAPAPYRDIASIYLKTDQSELAKKTADEIAKKFDDPASLKFLAEIYFLTSSFKEAAYYYEKILESEPDSEAANLYLANYYYIVEPQLSLKYWKKLIEIKPSDESTYRIKMGEVYEKLNRYTEAIESYNSALKSQPTSKEAYLSLGRVYEVLKDTKSAILSYNNYLQYEPENLEILKYLGALYFTSGNIIAAEEIFKKVVAMATTTSSGYVWLGIISAEKNDIDEAIEYFEKAVAIELSANIFQYLSELYAKKKDYKTAENYLKKAIKENPSEPKLKFFLGLLNMDMEKYKVAIKYFTEATKLKPDYYDAYFYTAVSYDRLRKFTDMRKQFEHLIKINPDHASAKNYLAYSLAERNIELDYAEKLVTEALIKEPENYAYIDTLGWIYFKKGKLQEAEKEIRRAAMKANDWEIFYHLGIINEELKKPHEALKNYISSMRHLTDKRRQKEIRKRIIYLQKKQDINTTFTVIIEELKKISPPQKIECQFVGKAYSQTVWGEISYLSCGDIIVKIGSNIFPVVFRLKEQLSVHPFGSNEFPNEQLSYIIRFIRDLFSGEIYHISPIEKYKYSTDNIIVEDGKYAFDRFTGDIKYFQDGRHHWLFSDYSMFKNTRLPQIITLKEKNKDILKLRLKKIEITDEKNQD